MSDGNYVSNLASCLSGTRSYLKLCQSFINDGLWRRVTNYTNMHEQKHNSNQVIKDEAIFIEPS